MKKLFFLIIIASMVFGGSVFAQSSAYDKATSVQVMRDNASLLGQINAAASRSDFYVAAEKLMLMAQGMSKLLSMVPPKGDKAQWENTIKAFLDAAYKGIGACGTKDLGALQASIKDLRTLNSQGHKEFK